MISIWGIFFFWEDENNEFLKLWFLKTFEAPTNPILKIISFGYVDSYAKTFLILYPPFENSTTRRDKNPLYLWLNEQFKNLVSNAISEQGLCTTQQSV